MGLDGWRQRRPVRTTPHHYHYRGDDINPDDYPDNFVDESGDDHPELHIDFPDHVLVRRADYDNLATAVDKHDNVFLAARRLVNNVDNAADTIPPV
jgi:hypothetical protein